MADRPPRAGRARACQPPERGAAWKADSSTTSFPFDGSEARQQRPRDTSLEKLGDAEDRVRPQPAGTLTAGNSSPLTDGAACVLLASEEWAASKRTYRPGVSELYRNRSGGFRRHGRAEGGHADGAGLRGAAHARPRRLTLQDFDIYEIHEAFAAQVLCTLKAWESEDSADEAEPSALGRSTGKMNPVGSSVAIGHPFAATGARIVATLAKQLAQRGSGRGLISICAAGGHGRDRILER
jgi:acetyl-CoA C-acetyltransferase